MTQNNNKTLLLAFIFLIIFCIPSLALMKKVKVGHLLGNSDMIVSGVVTDIKYHWSENDKSIYTKVFLSIKDNLKGKYYNDNIVIDLPGGQWDGITQKVSDIPVFKIGEKTLVFLTLKVNPNLSSKISLYKKNHLPVFCLFEKFQGKYSLNSKDASSLYDILQLHGPLNSFNIVIYEKLVKRLQKNLLKEKKITEIKKSNMIITHPTYSYMADGAHWSNGAVIRYKINSNCVDVSSEGSAIINAAASWSSLNPSACRWQHVGSSSATTVARNGTNLVFWDAGNGGSTLAISTIWYSAKIILETDIRFYDGDHLWNTNGSRTDIETVALHEMGHSLGLGHDVGIMAPIYGGTARRIDTDNRNGFYSLYGNPNTTTVSITSPLNGNNVNNNQNIKMTVFNKAELDHLDLYIKNIKVKTFKVEPFIYNWDTTTYSEGNVTLKAIAVSNSGVSQSHKINVIVDNVHTLHISILPNGSGTVKTSPDKSEYRHNEKVTLTSNPKNKYVFLKWENDLGGNQNPISFKMIKDTKITAKFNLPPVVKITTPLNNSTLSKKTLVIANATDNNGIKSVKFYIDGTLKKTDYTKPYTYNWDVLKYSIGVHTIRAKATDKVNLSSYHDIQTIISKIKLNISAVRQTVSSWLFSKEYGILTMTVNNPQNIPVFEYVLYHKIVGGVFQEICRFTNSEFSEQKFVFQDKYLESGKNYIFMYKAFGPNNQLLGSSPEIQL